ncbi:MAG: acetyl-CoA carboxylase biotin carboxylase subunit [Nitratireductor sp.]
MKKITKLLIANRGEIAYRIARTAHRMGIASVAVYSEADHDALHVSACDEAVAIGPAAASQSYLNQQAIIDAARLCGADAIHPGYGFLSENATFASACRAAGLVFVGPSADAISAMGDKAEAKAVMQKAGVPTVPGYSGNTQDDKTLAGEADRTGYPLLIKAVGGGGGRGMRIVRDAASFGEALASARREALSAFGSDAVLLERLIENGRHIEVQVFGDSHGNVVHLFERDCSAQRRHQKIIEEAPSPFVDETLRERLGGWAVAAARAVAYEGAGTVEFIVDADGNAFFLEMNTRLQVEHPVTEMITGLDLVEWQLRVACGEELPLGQEQISLCGHGIEARLYAEDPDNGFMPQAGPVAHFEPPQGTPTIRVDSGVATGCVVPPDYDAMVAKFIVQGADRAEAIALLQRLIADTPLFGIKTNSGFLMRLVGSDAFRRGEMTTRMIDDWIGSGGSPVHAASVTDHDFALAAIISALNPGGDWYRSSGVAETGIELQCGAERRKVLLRFERGRLALAKVGDVAIAIDGAVVAGSVLALTLQGRTVRHAYHANGGQIAFANNGEVLVFEERLAPGSAREKSDPLRPVAPVTGVVTRVLVEAGTEVVAGAALAVIEAMKMETTVAATVDGRVNIVHIVEGGQAKAGMVVCEIEGEGK